jgi:hypothetical protein
MPVAEPARAYLRWATARWFRFRHRRRAARHGHRVDRHPVALSGLIIVRSGVGRPTASGIARGAETVA